MKCVLFVIGIVFFAGCENKDRKNEIRLVKVDEVAFTANDFISVNPAFTHLIESDSGSYLFAFNHVVKNFQFINMDNGVVVREIVLNYEGPNSVGGFTGATITALDSIWLLTSRPPKLNLLNFEGEIVLEKEIKNDVRPFPINYLFVFAPAPLIQYKQTIFGPQPLLEGHHQITKEDISKYQLAYSFDFGQDTVVWHDVYYSENYWDAGKKLSDFSWSKDGNKIFLAPIYDHEIQIFDMDSGKILNKKQVKSTYINSFNYVNEIPAGLNEGIKNRILHDRYGSFLFDKYREVFYRLFNPGYELLEELTMEELSLIDRSKPKTGIMILDKELNVLGEHLFGDFEIHSSSNMFVGEKGLYLSLNNENHPDYDENHFRYRVVRFDIEE